MARWTINIPNFLGGVAPYSDTLQDSSHVAGFGETNQAAYTQAVDLRDPNFLSPSKLPAVATNGDVTSGAIVDGASAFARENYSETVTYAVGGAYLYKITNSTVTDDANFPHLIDKAAVTAEDAEDVIAYQNSIYYTYNHSGTAGDIGKATTVPAFDDDWGSTTPTGAAALVGGVPHPMCVGGNDVLYIANGRYVASFDGTTLITQALDLPTGDVIQSLVWNADRLWIFAKAKDGFSRAYIWDGTTDSWEAAVPIRGYVGGSVVNNGQVYFFHKQVGMRGFHLSYIDGTNVINAFSTTHGEQAASNVPNHYQVATFGGFILFDNADEGSCWAWGTNDPRLPVRGFSMFADLTGSSSPRAVGTLGDYVLFSASNGTNHTIYAVTVNSSNYSTSSVYRTLLFDVSGNSGTSRIDTVILRCKPMASGARMDWSLVNGSGTTLHSDVISYAKHGTNSTIVYELPGLLTSDVKLTMSHSNGSATAPVHIRSVKITGDTQDR